jgi:hypothetical protein
VPTKTDPIYENSLLSVLAGLVAVSAEARTTVTQFALVNSRNDDWGTQVSVMNTTTGTTGTATGTGANGTTTGPPFPTKLNRVRTRRAR